MVDKTISELILKDPEFLQNKVFFVTFLLRSQSKETYPGLAMEPFFSHIYRGKESSMG